MREQQRQLVKAQEQAKEAKEQARKWEREAKVVCTPMAVGCSCLPACQMSDVSAGVAWSWCGAGQGSSTEEDGGEGQEGREC